MIDTFPHHFSSQNNGKPMLVKPDCNFALVVPLDNTATITFLDRNLIAAAM